MNFKWTRESILILILALAVLLGGFYYGQQLMISPAQEAEAGSSRILSDQQELLEKIEGMEASQQSLETNLEVLHETIPVSSDPSAWMAKLKELADQHQMEIVLLTNTEAVSSNTVESIENTAIATYQLELEYNEVAQLNQLITDLYALQQLTDIQSIFYEADQSMAFKAALTIQTYHQSNGLETEVVNQTEDSE